MFSVRRWASTDVFLVISWTGKRDATVIAPVFLLRGTINWASGSQMCTSLPREMRASLRALQSFWQSQGKQRCQHVDIFSQFKDFFFFMGSLKVGLPDLTLRINNTIRLWVKRKNNLYVYDFNMVSQFLEISTITQSLDVFGLSLVVFYPLAKILLVALV